MKEVAEKAGVSTATVSRALMNPEKVSASTREKVEAAAKSVGYLPHPQTRSIKRIEAHTVLVFVPDICDPFFSEIIRGIEVTATRHGYLVLISDCAHQNQRGASLMDLVATRQIDGLVLLGSRLPFNIRPEDMRLLPPVVMANEFDSDLELPTVHIDNLTAAFEAVNHLLKYGHKRIACLTGPDEMPLSQYRLQGYIQALRRSSIAIDNTLIIRGNFTFEAGKKTLKTLMTLANPPEAIFCHSDIMALGVITQAKEMGLRVPEDLSVIGFDDIEMAQCSDPPLTTVTQPRYAIGAEAMKLLLEQLEGKTVSSGSRLLEFELKIRASTAPPRLRMNFIR